ncbi:MAG: TauD/TfdA family dioxygenase [Acidiferrobacterales bacterium]|nr:TauD/TfdA family dioxygenase [Acidiferrobacterales bacterium]
MKFKPLSSVLGIEVSEVDVTNLSNDEFTELRMRWVESDGLAVIRGQTLTPHTQTEFSRRFGTLFGEADHFQDSVKPFLHPEYPTIYRVSNKKNTDGEALGRSRAGSYWHSDVSFRKHPAMASLLYGIEIPPVGGDTIFASQVAAYEALSPAMKTLLSPLDAVHDFRVAAQNSGTYATADLASGDFDGQNSYVHPVVITHPESRKKSLFVNPGFTSHLLDFDPTESAGLLNIVYEHSKRPEFNYRHSWRTNDLVIWDNRSTMHLAIQDYTADRYMHRSTVVAGQPAR